MKSSLVFLASTAVFLLYPFLIFSQNQNIKNRVWYDEWPTIESNANILNFKSGEITTDFVLIGRVWDHRILTYFFQNGTPDIAGNNEELAIQDAMDIWTNWADILFIEVCTQAEADISFLFGAFNHGDPVPQCEGGLGPFDGAFGVLAHNMGGPDPGNNCGVQGGDVHFDESEAWTDVIRNDGAQPIDLVTVAAHELGHALGLFHTQVSGSLMLGPYSGSHRFLGADDIAGIQTLYEPQGSNNIITGPGFVCATGTPDFTLTELPAGSTINWSVSPTNLFTVDTGTGNSFTTSSDNDAHAAGTITATITNGCGQIDISIDVWVGHPLSVTGTLSGPAIVGTDDIVSYSVPSQTQQDGSFHWTKPRGFDVFSNGEGYRNVRFWVKQWAWSGYVQVWKTNACGNGGAKWKYVTVDENMGCTLCPRLQMSPNPADDHLNILYLDKATNTALLEKVFEEERQYLITDFYGNTISVFKSYNTELDIDLREINNGLYIITITHGSLGTEQLRFEVSK